MSSSTLNCSTTMKFPPPEPPTSFVFPVSSPRAKSSTFKQPDVMFPYVWTVANITDKINSTPSTSPVDKLQTDFFTIPGHESQWYFDLLPQGLETTGSKKFKGHIVIVLCSLEKFQGKVGLECFVKKHNGRPNTYIKTPVTADAAKAKKIYPHANCVAAAGVAHSDLKNPAKLLLKDDQVELYMKVTITGEERTVTKIAPLESSMSENDGMTELCGKMVEMWKRKELTDVSVKCGGEVFRCHKHVLAARSPVFKARFETSVKDVGEIVIDVDELEVETVKEMINYMYTGTVKDLTFKATGLLEAANRFNLPGLKAIAEQNIIFNMELYRALDIFLLVERHNAEVVRSVAKEMICGVMENLKHIFTVSETVEKTKNLIEEGNLLMAHQALIDLENSRDALLLELDRVGRPNVDDLELLSDYFREVSELSLRLEKQLMFILLRAFATVRTNPEELVTALQIIEREELSDEDCLNKQQRTGFLPPNRPKLWRKKCLEKLSESVQRKMEGSILETREENKMWLVRYLEIIRMIMLEDLRIAKHHLAPCFPPSYDIFAYCVALYHSVVSGRLQTVIEDGLEGQENVHMLEWVSKTYPGPTLMGSPALGLDSILPILDEHIVVNQLIASYLDQMKKNFSSWMNNTIKQEREDWCSEKPPDIDADDFYHTASPVIIYQMVDENLQVANTISRELVHKVLILGIEQLGEFGGLYRQAVTEFKNKYFKERAILSPGQFTAYMIAIINNCDRFEVLSQEMKGRWWKAGHHDVEGLAKFEQLLKMFREICQLSVSFLLKEVFEDIEREINFSDLVTIKWQDSSQIVETVCVTLGDYFGDYKRLKENNFERVAMEAQLTVARKYITAMLQNTILKPKNIFTGQEKRRTAALKIKSEANHCKTFFIEVAGDAAKFDSPFDVIVSLADVLDCDRDMLFLELGTLCFKYPDVTHSQIMALLLLRGDINKLEAKQRASEFSGEGGANRVLHAKSVLGDVNLTAVLGNKLIPVAANLTDKLSKLKE